MQSHPVSIHDLQIHPAVARLWMMEARDPRFVVLVDSIADIGILEPLRITPDRRIIDGRHRFVAARSLQLETVPCVIDEDASGPHAAEVALESLVARRHLVTRGQLAYVSYPLLAQAHEALLQRRERALADGRIGSGVETVSDLAARIGVSREEFLRAAKLHALFKEHPAELRLAWEPRIMAQDAPIGLGAAIAGIAGGAATTGKTPERNSHLARWDAAWTHMGKPAMAWTKWTAEEREHASETMRKVVMGLPAALLDELRDALRAARRAEGEKQ